MSLGAKMKKYFDHETMWSVFVSDQMTFADHESYCMENPAHNAYANGALWIKKNRPSLKPVFWYSRGSVWYMSTRAIAKKFTLDEQEVYLAHMDDEIKAASRAGNVIIYDRLCSAIADLILARCELFEGKLK